MSVCTVEKNKELIGKAEDIHSFLRKMEKKKTSFQEKKETRILMVS